MRNYQTLTLIGGIFGIVVVPIILFGFASLALLSSALTGSSELDSVPLGDSTAFSIVASIFISMIAITIVFVTTKTKVIGVTLLILALISLMVTNISGILTWILFFVAGIVAIKFKEYDSEPRSNQNYLRCEYCGMFFEKEVDKLNHLMTCEKKTTKFSKDTYEKPNDSFKASAELKDNETLDELERKLKEDRDN